MQIRLYRGPFRIGLATFAYGGFVAVAGRVWTFGKRDS